MRQLIITNRSTNQSFRFPALPSEVSFTHGVSQTKVTVDQLGDFAWPSGRAPTEYSFSGKFWGPDRINLPFIDPTAYRTPPECIQVLETWHDAQYGNFTPDGQPQRLYLLLTGSDVLQDSAIISKDVFISTFTHKVSGAMGDIDYSLTLTEWRSLQVLRDTGGGSAAATGGAETASAEEAGAAPEESDPDAPPLDASFTVEPGDTMASIAQKTLGDSSRWQEIYDIPENQAIIGGDPNLIMPGMQLHIPGGQNIEDQVTEEDAAIL